MLKFNNRTLIYNNRWLNETMIPIVLPSYTIRLLYKDGVTPTFVKGTGVQVSESPNIWDLTYNNNDWSELLSLEEDLLEVLGANTSNVTNMALMFNWCRSLRSVALFDTSNVTNMGGMFAYCQDALTTVPIFDTSNVTNMGGMFIYCTVLTTVPLFNTSKVKHMNNMFRNCINVESGILALYQQASTQTTPPAEHSETFWDCGIDTVTGAAELAQIPSDWK
mgnify:CR=1 FL=1